MTAKLVILSGPPACGKSTLAKSIEIIYPGVRLSLEEELANLNIDFYDEERCDEVIANQWRKCEHMLLQDKTVILDWNTTFWPEDREELRRKAKALGAEVHLFFFLVSRDLLFRRILERTGDMMHPDLGMIVGWVSQFKAPCQEERLLFDKVFEIHAW